MKRQFTSILLFSALLVGGASTFVSCKDYDSDERYEANAEANENIAKLIAQHAKDVEDLNKALAAIKECSCKDELGSNQLAQVKAQIEEQIKNNETIIAELKNQLTNNITNDQAVQDAIINLVNQHLGEDNEDFKSAVTKIILGDYQDLNTAIKESEAYKEVLTTLAGNNDGLKDSINTVWNDLYSENGKIAGITSDVDQLLKDMAYTKALAQADSQRIDTLSARLYQEIELATQKVIDMIPSVPTDDYINGLIDKKIPSEDYINGLIGTKLTGYYSKTEIDDKIGDIKTEISNLKNSVNDILSKQVSGIIVQASESPITGYENTPFGVQVGIVGAYYGYTETGFTDFNEKRISQNKNFVADVDDNAGVIYVTVNPANVNPEAICLRLVDSQGNAIASTNPGEDTPYILEWANTDKVLKFGGSRAATTSSNGFYAVKLKLNSKGVDDTKIWTKADKDNLKEVGKNILDKMRHPRTSRLNVADIVSTLNSTFNNRLTAYGLEASWSQLDTDGKLVSKKVTSKLGLAAIALNPLSFDFLAGGINVDLPTIPTLQSRLNFADYKFNWKNIEGLGTVKTSVVLKDMPDLDKIKVSIDGKIQAPKVDANGTIKFGETEIKGVVNPEDNTVTVNLGELEKTTTAEVKVTVDDIVINPDDVKITLDTSATKDMTYDVEIPMDEFNKIIDNINGQVGNMIENVNGMIDKVNGWTETIDGQLINRINSYIKKFENVLTKANSLIQPAMFYTTNSGNWNQLARIPEGASYLKLNGGQASTVFIASSYTAELLAPAYQKRISVDGGATLEVGDKSGSSVVLDGNKYKVGFKATKPGVYTITYEAIDYSGQKVSKPFYVKVVE